MEELRSTDALEKEIREDARKKAQRLLEKAEQNANALLAEADEKIKAAKEEALSLLDQTLLSYEKSINASIPLEKQRLRIRTMNTSLMNSLNNYFSKLGEEKRSALIKSRLLKMQPLLGEKDFEAKVIGGSEAKLKAILSEALGKHLASCAQATERDRLNFSEQYEGLIFHDGFVLIATDGSMIVRLTLDEIVKELLEEHSEKLFLALYNGRLPE